MLRDSWTMPFDVDLTREAARIPTVSCLLLLGLALVGSSCGAHRRVAVRRGTIEIPRDMPTSSVVKGVLGLGTGSTTSDVRSALGQPFAKVAVNFRGGRRIRGLREPCNRKRDQLPECREQSR
jgi:hypothetical protein